MQSGNTQSGNTILKVATVYKYIYILSYQLKLTAVRLKRVPRTDLN